MATRSDRTAHPPQLQHFHQQQLQHHISFATIQPTPSSSTSDPDNFANERGSCNGVYDLGTELDQALFQYLHGHHESDQTLNVHEDRSLDTTTRIMRPSMLNIFPSQPMHIEPAIQENAGIVFPSTSVSAGRQTKHSTELDNPTNDAPAGHKPAEAVKCEGTPKGLTWTEKSELERPKTPDTKILRRLAQNREAARKSRLRKKVYVQQLESSRMRLNQLEQELQRASAQGVILGGIGRAGGEHVGLSVGGCSISSEAATFNVEHARWLEENHHRTCELRTAVQEHLPESKLRLFVDNVIAHYDEMLNLRAMLVKSDVFHLLSGIWMTPAERCFMWVGGFRPSELIKVILNQVEPLTEQQIVEICGLQRSTQESEEALSQGLEALNHSLSDAVACNPLFTYPPNMPGLMSQMAVAVNKLSTLESFVAQADNLRHQTIHRLHQLLTTHQAARCLLAIAEYFHRLRALSSIWLSRPRQPE